MIFLKNNSEIEKLYYAGQIVKETLLMLEEHIIPGEITPMGYVRFMTKAFYELRQVQVFSGFVSESFV